MRKLHQLKDWFLSSAQYNKHNKQYNYTVQQYNKHNSYNDNKHTMQLQKY